MIIVTSEHKHGTIKIREPTRNKSFAIIDERVASGNNAHHGEYYAVIFYPSSLTYSQTV